LNPTILFVHNHLSSFVRTDRDLLRERFILHEWIPRGRAVNLAALARQVAQADLVFGWFASWHTFFPVLLARCFKRPSILVVGGYDTANLPEIGYGNLRGGFKRWITGTTLKMATTLIAFSEYSCREIITHTRLPADRIEMLYLGVTPREYRPLPKVPSVVTVGNVDKGNLERKGLVSFVRSASLLPNVPYTLVGAWRDTAIDRLRQIASCNVEFVGWVSDSQLSQCLARTYVYVQASRHEGFGLAVAEAMLHQCIPVVTRAGALPEVVGDAGIYVDSPEPRALAEGIHRALQLDSLWGQCARERILHEFPLERRRQGLYRIVDEHV